MVVETSLEIEPLYSTLATDPERSETVEKFVLALPDHVARLTDCADRGEWEALGRIAHQIKGAVSRCGFSQITPFANRVELAVRHNEPEDVVRRAIEDLIDLCRRVRKGTGLTE